MNNDSQLLVSTQWLEDHLDAPDVRILDATYFMPEDERDGRAEYESSHIPGARFPRDCQNVASHLVFQLAHH